VTSIGHGVREIAEAMATQARKVAFVPMHLFTSEPLEALAEAVAKFAPGDLNRVWFVSGGSEATENAAKLARQYWIERGKPSKSIVMGRWQSFHGNTLGSMAFGGHTIRRRKYVPMFNEGSHLPPMYCYRCHFKQTYPACDTYCADYLERLLRMQGPENVAAFIAEPVVGATMGAVPAVPGYFRRIREICSAHGVLLILDEVMCGMGRTGTLHACEQEGAVPDLLVIAKGLGGGYQPIGAVLAQAHIVEAFQRGSGAFQHGHTYIGHAVACAAALAVQRVIARDHLLDAVRRQGEGLAARLRHALGEHPHVGDLRGRGLFRGIELVADRDTRTPFEPDLRLHARIKAQAMARGLMVYPMGGTIDGQRGDHVLLAPPFIVSDSELDQIVERLTQAIDASLAEWHVGAAR